MIKLKLSYSLIMLSIFLFSCGGGGSSDSQPSATVPTLVITTPAPTVTLSKSSSSVELSNETTLTWSSTNTKSCAASGDRSGDNNVTGSQVITNTTTGKKSYLLTCTGNGGAASEKKKVTILEPTPAPTITLSASSSSVELSNEITINWSSTNTTSCLASGDWSGDNDVTGSQAITNTTTGEKSYVLTCTGKGGTASKTVILTILEFSVVIATAKPNAATVKLLTDGFNQPLDNNQQWSIFNSNIDTFYISQYNDIQNNLNQAFGKYSNFNYLMFDLDGSDDVNQPVLDRLIELKFVGWEGGYTTEELKSVAGCLTGSKPNGDEKGDNYELQSICITNIQFVMFSHGFFDPNYQPEQWRISLDNAVSIQHEYFHHYQGTHALDRGLDFQDDADNPDNTVNSPRWWTEGAPGAAEYWWLRSNWMMIDSLKDLVEVQPFITQVINDQRNKSFWWYSQRLQKGPPYINPNGDENGDGFSDCSSWMLGPEHAYPWPLPDGSDGCANEIAGSAPIHFMAHKSSWQAVLRDIPADYYEYGFWGAVEIHTGLNQQQFYAEFNAIMRSVDWTTMDRSYAPEGWNIPDTSIEETVDFLNITPYSLEDIPDEVKVTLYYEVYINRVSQAAENSDTTNLTIASLTEIEGLTNIQPNNLTAYLAAISASDGDDVNTLVKIQTLITNVNASNNSTGSVRNDVDGDGKADIVWRNSDSGKNALWSMNGLAIGNNAGINTVANQNWQIAGRGDFDGDGKSDLLWRNDESGSNVIYLMDGDKIVSTEEINQVPLNWDIKAVADFDGDGKDDIFWRNTRGDTAIYLMNGSNIVSAGNLIRVVNLYWEIVDAGDVNGDGKDDVIWRHKVSGVNVVWLLDGLTLNNSYQLNTVSTSWLLAGLGDINGDGTSDLIWRNQINGRNVVYLMNTAGQIQRTLDINVIRNQDWQIADILDLNGDGKDDIFWRNSTQGDSAIYLMNGNNIESSANSNRIGAVWQNIR